MKPKRGPISRPVPRIEALLTEAHRVIRPGWGRGFIRAELARLVARDHINAGNAKVGLVPSSIPRERSLTALRGLY